MSAPMPYPEVPPANPSTGAYLTPEQLRLQRQLRGRGLPSNFVNRLVSDAGDCGAYWRVRDSAAITSDIDFASPKSGLRRAADVSDLQRALGAAPAGVERIESINNLDICPAGGVPTAQLITRCANVAQVPKLQADSSYCTNCFCGCVACCCYQGALIPAGQIGATVHDDTTGEFLGEGYHLLDAFDTVAPATDPYGQQPTIAGTNGFIFIPQGRVGIFACGASHRYVLEGLYTWDDPQVRFVATEPLQLDKVYDKGGSGFVIITDGRIGRLNVAGASSFLLPGIYQWCSSDVRVGAVADLPLDGQLVSNGTCGIVTVRDGSFGAFSVDSRATLVQRGIYYWDSPSVKFIDQQAFKPNKAFTYDSIGFITVADGFCAVLEVEDSIRLLANGTYQWSAPNIRVKKLASLTSGNGCIELGPYTLVNAPEGTVAVTYHNGALKVLGNSKLNVDASEGGDGDAAAVAVPVAARGDGDDGDADCTADCGGGSTALAVKPGYPAAAGDAASTVDGAEDHTQYCFFLDDPKWSFSEYLSLNMQTDKLPSNNLLSRDNVELVMTAMSQWRIRDPVQALTRCAPTMAEIHEVVNDLIRATIARIVAGTNIGDSNATTGGVTHKRAVPGPVTGTVVGAQPEPSTPASAPAAPPGNGASPSGGGDAGLSNLMQSDSARRHMSELAENLDALGIEVVGVFVPEKRMVNDDIRREVAKQAVIGIKADAERASADAKAYSTVKSAFAEAEAIRTMAQAHQEAGQMLGGPESTSARLALTEAMAKTLTGTNMTVFSGAGPHELPYMLSGAPGAAGAVAGTQRMH